MTTPSLPVGTYKISAKWRASHTSTSNSMLFDITLNGTPLGTNSTLSIEPKDDTNNETFTAIQYNVISGVNTILLRYWNESSSTTISDAAIELIRVS
jgi:hypothetical protein